MHRFTRFGICIKWPVCASAVRWCLLEASHEQTNQSTYDSNLTCDATRLEIRDKINSLLKRQEDMCVGAVCATLHATDSRWGSEHRIELKPIFTACGWRHFPFALDSSLRCIDISCGCSLSVDVQHLSTKKNVCCGADCERSRARVCVCVSSEQVNFLSSENQINFCSNRDALTSVLTIEMMHFFLRLRRRKN